MSEEEAMTVVTFLSIQHRLALSGLNFGCRVDNA